MLLSTLHFLYPTLCAVSVWSNFPIATFLESRSSKQSYVTVQYKLLLLIINLVLNEFAIITLVPQHSSIQKLPIRFLFLVDL